MKKRYKFWLICVPIETSSNEKKLREWKWLCIPPDEKYMPNWYPKGALVIKHETEILPPLSYWLKPEYEELVYFGNY